MSVSFDTANRNDEPEQTICFNGEFIKESELSINSQNRSSRYGDGLFETIAMRNGELCYLSHHLERAWNGSRALGLDWENKFPDLAGFEIVLKLLASSNQIENFVRFRWQIWRSGRGTYAPETDQINYLISVQSAQAPVLTNKRAGIFTDVPVTNSTISAFKTCNALPYILAAREAKKLGLNEMLLLNSETEAIAEATASNVFWIKGNLLFTPDLSTGCITGIMRKQILNWCEKYDQNVQIGSFDKAHLLSADCAFITNSAGIHYLSEIAEKAFSNSHPLVEKLFQDLILKQG
jgi:4-amino-4-deoxychorismate lyase